MNLNPPTSGRSDGPLPANDELRGPDPISSHVYVLDRSQRIELPLQKVFDFHADAGNLALITPPEMGFRLISDGPIEMRTGALIEYRLKVHGVPINWKARVEAWEPPARFVDTQVKGPYKPWEHTHSFEPDGENAVVIHDHVRYSMPLGPLGRIAHALFVRRELEKTFDYRQEVIAGHLERSAKSA